MQMRSVVVLVAVGALGVAVGYVAGVLRLGRG
jgi:hypothetical protein